MRRCCCRTGICPPPPADRHRTRRHWPIAPPGAPASPPCRPPPPGAPPRGGNARPPAPAGPPCLANLPAAPDTLLLRDYHKDNLMWLPARPGVMACGLLDFQDAQQGHPSYDLVSLIEAAPRAASPAVH